MSQATLHNSEQSQPSVGFDGRYSSRPRVLAQWFEKSRDQWKEKHQQLKRDVKRMKVRVADVVKSRDHWRQKAEQAQRELQQMKISLEQPASQIQPPSEKKRTVPLDL